MIKKTVFKAALFAAATLAPCAAFAWPVNVSVGGSTLGLGVQVATAIVPGTLDVRAGFSYATFNGNARFSSGGNDIPFTGSLRLQGIPILLDYYPFHGAFRLSGGMVVNENDLTAVASGGSGTYTINGDTYTAQQVGTLTGKLGWRRIAPYIGIGWGMKAARHSGLSMGFDLGVMFTGSPTVSLHSSNPTNNQQLAKDVAAAQATANSKVSPVRYWPVIGLTFGYAF